MIRKKALSLLLSLASSLVLPASPFSYDVYFDEATNSTLTFGMSENAVEKPMPPDFTAVKYAYFRGGGNSADVRNTEDYAYLSQKMYPDSTAATWILETKSDLSLSFSSSAALPTGASLALFESGEESSTAIADGVKVTIKAGKTYEIRYSENGVVQLPAPSVQSVSFIQGRDSVEVTLPTVSEHDIEIIGGSEGVQAYAADGTQISMPRISISQVQGTTYSVSNIPADAAYFKFAFKVLAKDDTELSSESVSVLGKALNVSMSLADATAEPAKSADFELAKKQVIVVPTNDVVNVTLDYAIDVADEISEPYLLIDTGAQEYAAGTLSAKQNGVDVSLELASADNPYIYKAMLTSGAGSFTLSADVDKTKTKDYIIFRCGGEGLDVQEVARFNVLVSGLSIDFDGDGLITLDDANYLLNYRKHADLLAHSTANATAEQAAVAQEIITSLDARLDFDGNGTADVKDALMYYNYLTQGGANNVFMQVASLLPEATEDDNPAAALEFFRGNIDAMPVPQSAPAILSFEAKNYILGVSTECEVKIYAESAMAIQSMAIQMSLPERADMASVKVEKASLDANMNTAINRGFICLSMVGEQGAETVMANKKTLLATITFAVNPSGLAAGDTMTINGGYGYAILTDGQTIDAWETTNCAKGGISVIKSLPADWNEKKIKGPKTPVVEVSGSKGTRLTATVSAFINHEGETDPALLSEEIEKIHWTVSDASGKALAEAWSDAKGGWADADCTQKLGKAVVGEWFVSTSKATVAKKTGEWTSKVTVTTAAFNTLAGVDRLESDTFKINAEVIDTLGGASTYSWDVEISDKDQLAVKPTSLMYSIDGGATWTTKPPAITATDTLMAKAMLKSGQLIIDAPEFDADGDPIDYFYQWYSTSKPDPNAWKTAADGGNVLPPHGFGETWKIQVKAFSKPEYASELPDDKFYTAALTGASVKIANSEPTASAIEKTIDEDGVLVIDLLGEGYVNDPDMATDTFTFTVTNLKGKEVNSFTTEFGGEVSIEKATGILTYAACGKTGTDTFTYTVVDKSKKKAQGTVTVTLTELDEAPEFAVKDFFVGREDYFTAYDITLKPGPDYPEDEQEDGIQSVKVSLVNSDDADYFTVAPVAMSASKSAETGLWTSTLVFGLKEDTPYGIVIPCRAVAADIAGHEATVEFRIVTGVTPWYPVHKAVFAAQADEGVTFKVKEIVNGKVSRKVLVTVSIPKDENGECVIRPADYVEASSKFAGLAAGKTYYFEEYSYSLNTKGKAVIDKKCIPECALTVDGTCEQILDYPTASPDGIGMTYVSSTVDKKGVVTYTFRVSSKLANSVIVTTLNEKGKKVKQYKPKFEEFDEEGQLVQAVEVDMVFTKAESVSVQGVNPAGTGEERIFTVAELEAQVDEPAESIDDTMAAWRESWNETNVAPKPSSTITAETDEQSVSFSWPSCAVADGYLLMVFDEDGNLVLDEDTEETSVSATLGCGSYTWIVMAYTDDDAACSYPNMFEIVKQPTNEY